MGPGILTVSGTELGESKFKSVSAAELGPTASPIHCFELISPIIEFKPSEILLESLISFSSPFKTDHQSQIFNFGLSQIHSI